MAGLARIFINGIIRCSVLKCSVNPKHLLILDLVQNDGTKYEDKREVPRYFHHLLQNLVARLGPQGYWYPKGI